MPGEECVAVATPHDSNQPHPSTASLSPEAHHEDPDEWYAHDDEHSDEGDECENNVDDGPAPTNPPPSPILVHFTPQFECCKETALSKYSSRWNANQKEDIFFPEFETVLDHSDTQVHPVTSSHVLKLSQESPQFSPKLGSSWNIWVNSQY